MKEFLKRQSHVTLVLYKEWANAKRRKYSLKIICQTKIKKLILKQHFSVSLLGRHIACGTTLNPD